MPTFQNLVKPDLESVNALIVQYLATDVELVGSIGDHIIAAGGKRLRPIVALLTARALGAQPDKAHLLAAAIEFIHTATLLHDDVVDESMLRRGKATANANWGNAPTILVGDFVYSRSFEMLVEINDLNIMRSISQATTALSEGEVLQLVNAGRTDISEAEYYNVINAKTGRLFQSASEGAAMLAMADTDIREAAAVYGAALGRAFQIIDDLLDYLGDPQLMGKNIGDDLAEGKNTLPLIYTMSHGAKADVACVKNALEQKDTDAIADVITAVRNSGAIEYCRAQAQIAVNDCQNALKVLPQNQYTDALLELANTSLQRVM